MTASTYSFVTQTDLELQFTPERVAQIFSVQDADGASAGTVDAATLAYVIRMASAETFELLYAVTNAQMPFATADIPDTVKEITGIFVMYRGMMRRPEYATVKDSNPYAEAYKLAVGRLEKMRDNRARVNETKPSNAGGEFTSGTPLNVQPFYFNQDPSSGGDSGGFTSGSF